MGFFGEKLFLEAAKHV